MAESDVVLNPEAITALLHSDEVAKDLERRALRVEREAKRLCPVDTGRLRTSITHGLGQDTDGFYEDIGSNVEYARYVEFGTRFMAARAFLRGALGAAGDSGIASNVIAGPE